MISSPVVGFFKIPRRSHSVFRLALAALTVVTILSFLKAAGESQEERARHKSTAAQMSGWNTPSKSDQTPIRPQYPTAPPPEQKSKPHPIDKLMAKAVDDFDVLMNSQTHDLKSAAAAYRKKRGRHPPPGFDQWFQFATENNAIIVEEFFDQIHHDLAPFWGQPASLIRREAWDFEMTINVRKGEASAKSDWFWTKIWLEMVQSVEYLLPDMDIPLNAMDEPRLVASWEDVNKYMQLERESRSFAEPTEVIGDFSELPPPGEGELDVTPRDKNWTNSSPYWPIAARGCHPESMARQAPVMTDFDHQPHISPRYAKPHMSEGFVSNFSLSVDYCHQPDLQALHGAFIKPLTVSTSSVLAPLFGGSKLPTNNEILLPAPMYWTNEEKFSGGDNHGGPWEEKLDRAIWRGVASGGLNKEENWKGFQRHRFVAMLNSTQATQAQNDSSWTPPNWALPGDLFEVQAQKDNKLGEWVDSWSDASFVDLNCEPKDKCDYVDPYYSVALGLTMSEQFDNKYLPDIDGNSFSGRYRGFLMSSSLPIKATIFREWHDSRLVPWRHFVPMDNRFMDFYGIMQYFFGYEGNNDGAGQIPAHDKEAEQIASDGQEWANKVLRKEDMQIYVLRLLLEYARVSDDERESMGFVGDLL